MRGLARARPRTIAKEDRSLDRVEWEDLPAQVKDAITSRTGQITHIRMPSAGLNSPLAAIITAHNGMVFAKGMPTGARRVITQAREAAVAPLVQHISPALLWHLNTSGWDVLGYQYIEGRHADYRPGSPDLDMIISLMNALSRITVDGHTGPFKRAEDRWRVYVDEPEQAELLTGQTLTHSDWTPDNVLIAPGRAWLIDWAWPTLGAAWTDPACWILRLMASGGHTARSAERQAARLPAFTQADPTHIDFFAAANVRLWDEIVQQGPTAWTKEMARAAHDWATYRGCLAAHGTPLTGATATGWMNAAYRPTRPSPST